MFSFFRDNFSYFHVFLRSYSNKTGFHYNRKLLICPIARQMLLDSLIVDVGKFFKYVRINNMKVISNNMNEKQINKYKNSIEFKKIS